MNKKIGISGSWRTVNEIVERDVRESVRQIVVNGDIIVSGGALGVDWIATDEAMLRDPTYRQIQIILPTPLEVYVAHYFKRAAEGVIISQQAESLAEQLYRIREGRSESLEEMSYDVCTPETYYARNQRVIDESDELRAFQVNNSAGTQDAIDKALEQGKNVSVQRYTIP